MNWNKFYALEKECNDRKKQKKIINPLTSRNFKGKIRTFEIDLGHIIKTCFEVPLRNSLELAN